VFSSLDFYTTYTPFPSCFLNNRVVAVDSKKKVLTYQSSGSDKDRFTLGYAVIVLDVGSVTRCPVDLSQIGTSCTLTRPLATMMQQISAAEKTLLERQLAVGAPVEVVEPARVVVVGAGVAGVEVILSLEARFSKAGVRASYTLVGKLREAAFGSAAMVTSVGQELTSRGIKVLPDQRVLSGKGRGLLSLQDTDGTLSALPFNFLVLATGAAAPTWLAKATNLETDAKGFLLVRDTMASPTSEWVFAAGDCCSFNRLGESGLARESKRPGVYATREAPVIISNILEMLKAAVDPIYKPQLQSFHSEEDFVSMVATGKGTAIGAKFGLTFQGKWVWCLKDWIDRNWMTRFRTGREEVNKDTTRFADPVSYARSSPSPLSSRPDSRNHSEHTSLESLYGSTAHKDDEDDFADQWVALNNMTSADSINHKGPTTEVH